MLARRIGAIVGIAFAAIVASTIWVIAGSSPVEEATCNPSPYLVRAEAAAQDERVEQFAPTEEIRTEQPVPDPRLPDPDEPIDFETVEPETDEQDEVTDEGEIEGIEEALDVERAEDPSMDELVEPARPVDETEAVEGAPVDVDGVQPAPVDPPFYPSPFQAPPAQAPSAPANCYALGSEETGLLASQLSELCEGAPTPSGPVDCYLSAQTENVGVEAQRLELCRCAISAEPVECFVRMRSETGLFDYQIERLCAPNRVYELLPNCLPRGS